MFTFCPKCGVPFHQREAIPQECASCGFINYDNPRPVVLGVCVSGEKMLLVKRATPPFVGTWGLPGGFVVYGESPKDALYREIVEELDQKPKINRLLESYGDWYHIADDVISITVLVYEMTLVSNRKIISRDDISDAQWFSMNKNIPEICFDGLKVFLLSKYFRK